MCTSFTVIVYYKACGPTTVILLFFHIESPVGKKTQPIQYTYGQDAV